MLLDGVTQFLNSNKIIELGVTGYHQVDLDLYTLTSTLKSFKLTEFKFLDKYKFRNL
jgi:hypothetical protein